jgi:hypothetical protein
MQATNGNLTYDNKRIFLWEKDATDWLKKIYRTKEWFLSFLAKFFGEEVKEHYKLEEE